MNDVKIPLFNRDLFGSEEKFTKIGNGSKGVHFFLTHINFSIAVHQAVSNKVEPETVHVRHIRTSEPLIVKADSKQRLGVIHHG